MEKKFRLNEYNRINNEIRNIDMAIEKTESSANRMRHQAPSEFIVTQLSKIINKNIERREARDKFIERLEHLRSGVLDKEIRAEIKEQMNEANEKTRITTKKKRDLKADKEIKSVISKAYYVASRRQDRKNKYANKNMDRSYRHFTRACGSIPDYMRRNLSDMPNNKGYFWKSVACYGDLPAERGKPTVLFDRRRGGIMVIHEWTSTEHNVYEKKGKNRKVLVSSTKRKHIDLPPVCAEVQKRREKEEAERLSNRPRGRSSGRKFSGRSTRDRQRDNRTRDRQRDNRTRDRQRDNRTRDRQRDNRTRDKIQGRGKGGSEPNKSGNDVRSTRRNR